MVAFVASLLGTLAMIGVFWWYKARRPEGAVFTWGEAMLGSAYVFFGLFLAYGVLPNQWLLWADNDLAWRPDKTLYGPADILQPTAEGGNLPLTIHYQTLRDLIAVGIYVVMLGANIWLWSAWQNRYKNKGTTVEPVSEYGRPLVKEGV
ncbi:MAG: hypothetical protein OEW85_05685 [Acidimicrobiia bacterium]|nr:hypothetical protein [Acidimicrobiia bacterium]